MDSQFQKKGEGAIQFAKQTHPLWFKEKENFSLRLTQQQQQSNAFHPVAEPPVAPRTVKACK
jgi:hypothetical protein